jgi:hypothetical protein
MAKMQLQVADDLQSRLESEAQETVRLPGEVEILRAIIASDQALMLRHCTITPLYLFKSLVFLVVCFCSDSRERVDFARMPTVGFLAARQVGRELPVRP